MAVCVSLIATAATLLAVEEGGRKSGQRPKRVYQATRLAGPAPAIDGRLDDACWRAAGEWTGDYTQLAPRYEATASQRTELKILFDDRNLYVAIRAHDVAPEQRSRQAGDRDEFVGDIVGVTFDSYHDLRTGFEFDLTASGQKIDLRLLNDSWDTTWNAVWDGKVTHDGDGWSAEFLIPLSQLRYAAGNGVWGLHSWRWIDRLKEESDWNLLANDGSGFVQSFGELHGLEGLRAVRRFELLPFTSVKHETFAGGDRQTKLQAGLDAKIGLTSNITLDASILPDFGQVEADPAVMNLSVFETFLTERRPLFLEGKEIFSYPFGNDDDAVFYSRRIGQPPTLHRVGQRGRMPETTTLLGAAKISGKTAGGFGLGLLAAVTDEESVTVGGGATADDVPVAPRAAHVVLRGQQDFRRGDTLVGGIVTHVQRDNRTDGLRAWLPEQATVAGLDVHHFWADREYFFSGTMLASRVRGDPRAISRLQLSPARYYQRPVGGTSDYDATRGGLDGTGLWLKAGKASKGHWRWHEELLVKSPGLEFNDLGYLASADRIEQTTAVARVVKEPRAWYRSYSLELKQANRWSHRGEYLGPELELEAASELANKWNAGGKISWHDEGNDPVALRGGPLLRVPARYDWEFWMATDETRPVSVNAWWSGGRQSSDASHYFSFGGKLNIRPVRPLLITAETTNTRETNRMRPITLDALNGVPGYFVSRMTGQSHSFALRAQWIIRPELRLQYYGNPFGSTVRYAEFRRVVAPTAGTYAARFGSVLPANLTDGVYAFDENGDGLADYTLADPDGNDGSFHSNLVLKWEYRRGSMLYLVWSQQRAGAAPGKPLDAWDALEGLRRRAPNNQFMVKMTYWFSR
jgi:hypothetical protein